MRLALDALDDQLQIGAELRHRHAAVEVIAVDGDNPEAGMVGNHILG